MAKNGSSNKWRNPTREILDDLPLGIVVVDDKLRVRFLNHTMERLALAAGLDISGATSVGDPFMKTIPGAVLAEWDVLIERVLKYGERSDAKHAAPLTHDGAMLLKMSAAPMKNSQDETIAAVVSFEDVSESEYLLQRMEADAARFQHLWTSTCDMIIQVDRLGRILDFNMAFEEVVGYFKEEMVGTNLNSLLLSKRDSQFLQQIIEEGGYITNFETTMKTKTGKSLEVSLTIATLPKRRDGKSSGALALGRDISRRKKLEEDLEASQDALGDADGSLAKSRRGVVDGFKAMLTRSNVEIQPRLDLMFRIARGLALFLEMDDDDVEIIEEASFLSELGLIGHTADATSCHAVASAEILEKSGLFDELIPILRHHQERFDGTGDPDGLKGDQIPLFSRLLAVAERFSELSNEGMSGREEVLSSLQAERGSVLDPELVDALLELYRIQQLS